VNQREKEAYLREYSVLKSQGKPFFPYAVAKDGLMGCLVILIIIGLSIIFGAELGPKANAATTTYTPRPEWYFFFLFELLRVIKPPDFVGFATIGVPTLAMILLFLLPFYDRGPERHPLRRPIATTTGPPGAASVTRCTTTGCAPTAAPPVSVTVNPKATVAAIASAFDICENIMPAG